MEAARNDADTLTQRMESIHQSHTKAQQQTRKVHISIERCNQHIDKIRETLRALDTTLRDINSRLSVSNNIIIIYWETSAEAQLNYMDFHMNATIF